MRELIFFNKCLNIKTMKMNLINWVYPKQMLVFF